MYGAIVLGSALGVCSVCSGFGFLAFYVWLLLCPGLFFVFGWPFVTGRV
jgi:hypothetical protein